MRPALLYGRGGSLLAPLFDAAMEADKWSTASTAGTDNDGIVRWTRRAGGRYADIHTDVLADLYLLVCERAAQVGGCTFTRPPTTQKAWTSSLGRSHASSRQKATRTPSRLIVSVPLTFVLLLWVGL